MRKEEQKIWVDNHGKLHLENSRIIFRNFEGREGRYNKEGERNFSIIIENPEVAQQLRKEGYSISILKPREEGDDVGYHLKVKVGFKTKTPPLMVLVGEKNDITLTEGTCYKIDTSDIITTDVSCNVRPWENRGDSGLTCWLNTIYAVIEENPFAHKYARD